LRLRTLASIVSLVLVATACTAQGAPASTNVSPPPGSPSRLLTREERWTEDIDYLVEKLGAIHPDPFHGVPEETFDGAVHDLTTALPTLNDDEILVGIMHLVALISSDGRDGHMGVWPPDNPETVHRFPIRVWEFSDGLFVTAARRPNEGLAGSRILSIDGAAIDEVFRRLDPLVPRDNSSNLRAARSVFLTSAEVLAGIGIARARLAMELGVEAPDGTRRTVTIDAVDGETYADWVGGWELLLPQRRHLLFLRDPADAFWLEYLSPTRTLYVQYNVVNEHSSQAVNEIERAMRDHPVDRLVLDLRNNGGGEAGGYRDLLRFLAGPGIDRPGGLSVLIGRLTFSAAASLAVLLERRAANATFVGEDSGGAPNFWADPDTVTLPNSNISALIASRYFAIGGPSDARTSIRPDLRVAFTSSDYFSGRDPVLEAALTA
jgi:peptidase S41-like protein